MTTTQTDEHVLTVYKSAAETLTAMDTQMSLVDNVWGERDPKMVRECYQSLTHNTTHLFSMFFGSASKITRDGILSLFVSTSSGFVFGMIGHPVHYRVASPLDEDPTLGISAPLMGRYCMFGIGAGDYCQKPVTHDGPTCEGHDPLIFALPIPVKWSFHS